MNSGYPEINPIVQLLFILVFLVFCFVPTIVAYRRKHHNKKAILLLNLFLGWTGIGWVGALIWAATAVNPQSGSPPPI